MKKILILICLLVLLAVPSLAQDTLPPPHVTAIAAMDYSESSAELAWCVAVNWELVPGADFYLIRVFGNKGQTPIRADGSPSEDATWRLTESYSKSPGDPAAVMICFLAEKQKVKFRLRAIDYDNSDNQFGEKTAPFSVKLPKYGNAPVIGRFGVPTVEVFGSLR